MLGPYFDFTQNFLSDYTEEGLKTVPSDNHS